jgi:hypothetical protein
MNAPALNGMAVGAVIMFLFGAAWLLLGLVGGLPSSGLLRTALLVAGLVLAVWIGAAVRRVRHVSESAPPPATEQVVAGRQIGRRFAGSRE